MCPKQTGARTCLKQAGVGRVDQKLISLAPVQGIVAGQFGEVSEATHSPLATSRVHIAGPSVGKRGLLRSEEEERAIAIANLQR